MLSKQRSGSVLEDLSCLALKHILAGPPKSTVGLVWPARAAALSPCGDLAYKRKFLLSHEGGRTCSITYWL